MKRLLSALTVACSLLWIPCSLDAQERGAVALGEAIAGLGVSARVLVIAAHPDDEDTRLIAWLARGRHVRTAYLSLTRGDGGQNLIGNELGEALGVIRTEELLAARRIDGGSQYFTRAYDFGFSKSAEETFRHWPKDSLLRDVITVVRSFRPHVIVSIFSGTPRDGHGQHQAAGILAREAYDAAGDTARFPIGINPWKLPPWTPLKFYRSSRFDPDSATLAFNVGEYSPLLGRSYAEIAAESRSQHKSQGFGSIQHKGVVMDYVRREASRVRAPEDPKAERSIFDGIDTTWAQFRGQVEHPLPRRLLAALPAAIAKVQTAPYFRDPASVIGPLAALERLLFGAGFVNSERSLADSAGREIDIPPELGPAYSEAERRTSRALALATGVAMEATTDRELVSLGDSARVTLTVYNRGRVPIRVTPDYIFACQGGDALVDALGDRVQHGSYKAFEPDSNAVIAPDSARSWVGWLCNDDLRPYGLTLTGNLAQTQGPTQPWWLAPGRGGDMFRVASIMAPEEEVNAGSRLHARVEVVGTGGGPARFDVEAPVVHRYADPVRGDVSRPLAFVPAIAVSPERKVEYVPAVAPIDRVLRVTLRTGSTTPQVARVSLRLPTGLRADSARRVVTLDSSTTTRTVVFRVRGRLAPGRHTIRAVAESNGHTFTSGYTLIDYEHIRPQRMYRVAVVALEAVDVKLPPRLNVAYIPGVGDNVAPMLEQLGIPLTVLDPIALPTVDLARFTTIVVGPRAYESHPELVANNARLLDYARNGGTLVVQYGQYEMMQPGIMPYEIAIKRPHTRVTDETAPVRLVRADHRLLTTPNRIAARDFAGWVQERALYMPATFSSQYTPLLSMSDPGEDPNNGALLVAPYGRGTYVYTTLAFFRQLPAGVPGAARLFVNLLGAGQGTAAATKAGK